MDAERLVDAVNAALPDIKRGSLVVFGDIFGGRIDNIHRVVAAELAADRSAIVRFDEEEKLRVWGPEGVRVSRDEFRIEHATCVRWEWFYYGRARTPDNLHHSEHRVVDGRIEVSTSVDWYTPSFAPDLRRPAVELVGLDV